MHRLGYSAPTSLMISPAVTSSALETLPRCPHRSLKAIPTHQEWSVRTTTRRRAAILMVANATTFARTVEKDILALSALSTSNNIVNNDHNLNVNKHHTYSRTL